MVKVKYLAQQNLETPSIMMKVKMEIEKRKERRKSDSRIYNERYVVENSNEMIRKITKTGKHFNAVPKKVCQFHKTIITDKIQMRRKTIKRKMRKGKIKKKTHKAKEKMEGIEEFGKWRGKTLKQFKISMEGYKKVKKEEEAVTVRNYSIITDFTKQKKSIFKFAILINNNWL